MPYDPGLKKLIAKVEATRPDRIEAVKRGEHYPRLTMEERDSLLKSFHPDFRADAKRELRVGPNKGAVYPNELVNVLESRSRLDPTEVDLERVDYDVDLLIVGGGGAGCSAAVTASDAGIKDVLVATKLRLGDANTMMAEGGIQAADKENDTPVIHYLDVLGGGRFANHPELVEALVQDAPLVIAWLEKLGVMFDKTEDGTMRTLHGGGTSRKRMHSCGDITGAEIMRTLRDEVECRTHVKTLEFAPAVEIIKDEAGKAAGAVLYDLDRDQYVVARAKCTIISTGGFGRLHLMGFPTTNHYGATADGLAIAYHAGCELVFLESSQFHPTGSVYPEQIVGLLITEKFRGAGAQFLNIDAEQFVYPLETRDVASSALIRECAPADKGGRGKGIATPGGRVGIWLDSPMIEILRGPGTVRRDFPGKFRMYDNHDIDISREPMLIYPVLHYQNGGVAINADASSKDIDGLYFAGEVAGGIHGQNRLMGNSLLDVCVFGRRSGAAAAAKVPTVELGALSLAHVKAWDEEVVGAGLESEMAAPILFPDYRGKVM